MGQNFALEVFLHVIIERHVFGIAQAAVWPRLALDLDLALGLATVTMLACSSFSGRSTVMVR
jgi:hypothetical protein